MIIAVDFDGTIVYDAFPEVGEPRYKAFEVLKAMKETGHTLVLWTMRTNRPERNYLDEAVEFCKENGVEFDAVNEQVDEVKNHSVFGGEDLANKIYADTYIDDRNFYTTIIKWKDVASEFVKYDLFSKIFPDQINKI